MTNQEEYDAIIGGGGSEADYVASANNPLLLGQPASVLPIGIAGLGALVSALAVSGAFALRRKK
ncbi:MAG: hypothetical protein HYV26_20930 [Candidatus Hydrogenedentes bacterium]|nr:hypothetical protein [Candidatus Hydrogenedentota bacterium]